MRWRLLAAALVVPLLGACATKHDIRDLSMQIGELRQAQEASLREMRQQTALILDSLNVRDVQLRGYLSNRLVEIDRQLVQIQELSGQSQQGLATLRQEIREREEAQRAANRALLTQPPTDSAVAGAPDDLFSTSQAALERGSLTAARSGFAEFVRSFPQDPRAPDAELAIGETFEKSAQPDSARAAYQHVLDMYPDAPQSATALYRSALIEQDRGNDDEATSMLNQVIAAYPQSPEAQAAADQLSKPD